MKIIVADNSGFCFGVKKAMDSTMDVLESTENAQSKQEVHSLGPLIHNNQATEKLERLGLHVVDNIEDVDTGKIIIRSHGVPLDVYEKADENNIQLVDCTCPFVRKIQKKVKECYNEGKDIVIIGNPDHPEVIGINGWCHNKAYIINDKSDVETMPKLDKVCVVSQTTATLEKFTELSDLVSEKSSAAEIYNTICNATKLRQNSCRDIANEVDAMIIVGGYHSSNTQKLVEIARKYCKDVYHVETADELPLNVLKNYNSIGIAAGASTPTWIIEEVYKKMVDISKENENNENTENMEELLKSDLVSLNKGDIVEGEVISIGEANIIVNINYKADGIISKAEFIGNLEELKDISVGDKFDVLVTELNDGEGNVILSKKKVDNEKSLKDLETAFENGEVVTVKVNGVVKGGVTANVKGLRGFIPASQVSTQFIKDLNTLVGEELDVRIIEFDKKKNNIVLSRKQVEAEENESNKEKIWSKIQKGQKITGEVKRLANFGAFIDIGGIDGLAHISDLSWTRVSHPSEVLNVGDSVEVIILDLDSDRDRVSLGVKQLRPHPFEEAIDKYKVGDIVEGKVVRLFNFGAFVELEKGLDGLVHISQISDDRVSDPSEKLTVGETVKVKILNIDKEERKIELSIKEADTTKLEEIKKYQSSSDDEGYSIGDILGDIFKK